MKNSDSKQKMVDSAITLFQQRGYHGTSWRDLVVAGAAPRGSTQHFFPGGKEQLATEALDAFVHRITGDFRAVWDQHRRPGPAVHAWFRKMADLQDTTVFTSGCPIVGVAVDSAATSEVLAQACHSAFERWRQTLTELFVGVGWEAGRARDFAVLSLSSLEGALLMARAARSTEALRRTGALLETLAGLVT